MRLKVAVSADGRTAMANGESKWITGPAARSDVQRLRARSCAILTGAGTVLADDPELNVRDQACAVEGRIRQPLRVVADSRLRTPLGARIYTGEGPALIVHALEASPAPSDVEYLRCGDDKVDLAELLTVLAERKINELLVEAGPRLLGSFLRLGLWDELIVYQAGKLLGSAAQPLAMLPINHMADAIDATIRDCDRLGDDLRLRLVPKHDRITEH